MLQYIYLHGGLPPIYVCWRFFGIFPLMNTSPQAQQFSKFYVPKGAAADEELELNLAPLTRDHPMDWWENLQDFATYLHIFTETI